MIPVRDALFGTVGQLLRNQPISAAKVDFAWQSAVGPAMARATSVHLTSERVLRVTATSDHWRREAARSAGVIAQRMTVLLGPQSVRRIVVEKGS